YEPFGFKDGISQPEIDWDQEYTAPSNQADFTNQVAPGEFVLGYLNEYGKYTERPLAEATDPRAADLPDAPDVPGQKDVGRNGTSAVFRTLEQDVRGFWEFVNGRSASDPARRRELAESMVGRRMSGDPLVPQSSQPIPGIGPEAENDQNRFTFDGDL